MIRFGGLFDYGSNWVKFDLMCISSNTLQSLSRADIGGRNYTTFLVFYASYVVRLFIFKLFIFETNEERWSRCGPDLVQKNLLLTLRAGGRDCIDLLHGLFGYILKTYPFRLSACNGKLVLWYALLACHLVHASEYDEQHPEVEIMFTQALTASLLTAEVTITQPWATSVFYMMCVFFTFRIARAMHTARGIQPPLDGIDAALMQSSTSLRARINDINVGWGFSFSDALLMRLFLAAALLQRKKLSRGLLNQR